MMHTETIVIGGGQAGLAMSRCLTQRGVDHVVFERGRVAERWRSERWDSLRLLTPNWQSRLPGFRYRGADPDGFMNMPEVIRYLESYATTIEAPVVEHTTVRRVERHGSGYRVTTDRGVWRSDAVVIATGHAAHPRVPAFAKRLSHRVQQLVPSRYKNPASLQGGAVLVVGASASGVQIANELRATGRDVYLSVGRHTRLPRRYRGRDIMWWLDRTGSLARPWTSFQDLRAARRQPSAQLTAGRSLDLGTSMAHGIRLLGRTRAVDGDTLTFADDLRSNMGHASHRMGRVLDRIDRMVGGRGARPYALPVPNSPRRLSVRDAGIETVVWATGFSRRYPWLSLPVLDSSGDIRHHGGVTDIPGLYVLGMGLMRSRRSAFLDGVGEDAKYLAGHIHQLLGGPQSAAA